MTDTRRVELEERCTRLLADGQHLTARIEGLLQRPVLMESGKFDVTLDRLRVEQDEVHRQLELAMEELQALDNAS